MKNTRLLLPAALLCFGVVLGASAAPRKATPVKTPIQTSLPASVPPAVPGGPFCDVPANHWAAQAVETLRQKGIVRGYPAASRPASSPGTKAR